MSVQLSLFDYTPENCDAVEADSYELPEEIRAKKIDQLFKTLEQANALSEMNLYRISWIRKQQGK